MKKQILKNLFIVLFVGTSIVGCSNDEDAIVEEPVAQNTILGRWINVMYLNTLYEFTDDGLMHTIYSTNSAFGDISTAIPNPKSWTFTDNVLTIDLNFGNFDESTLVFKCNGNVVELTNEYGTRIMFREGYDYNSCEE